MEKIEKIEVVKDKGDVDIPYSALRYCFSSRDNVEVSVDELTKSGISFIINDKNEYKYEYDNEYSIFKKNKEAENLMMVLEYIYGMKYKRLQMLMRKMLK